MAPRYDVPDRGMNPPEPGPTGTIQALHYVVEVTVEGRLSEDTVNRLANAAIESLSDGHYTDPDVDEKIKDLAGGAIERALRDRLMEEGDDAITSLRLTHYDLTTE